MAGRLRHCNFHSLSIPFRGTVQAFSRLSGFEPSPLPNMRSADFSAVIQRPLPIAQRLFPKRTAEISRGKTRFLPCVDARFTKYTLVAFPATCR